MAEVFEVVRAVSINMVAEDDLFTVLMDGKAEKQLILSTTISGAAGIAKLISAGIKQIQKTGQKVEVPRIPEMIMNYTAAPNEAGDGVLIFLDGDRSKPLLGRMTPIDARRLAALLTAAAEGHAPKRAN